MGRRFPSDHLPDGHVRRLRAERLDEALRRAAVPGVLRRLAQVQQIGDRVEDRDRLHGAALAVHRVLGIRRARATAGGEHQAEVAPGASAGHPDARRVDPVGARTQADEADRAVHVVHDFHDRGLGLGDVADREDGVPAAEQRSRDPGVEGAGASRLPSPAHHEGHGQTVRLLRAQHVEGQVPACPASRRRPRWCVGRAGGSTTTIRPPAGRRAGGGKATRGEGI